MSLHFPFGQLGRQTDYGVAQGTGFINRLAARGHTRPFSDLTFLAAVAGTTASDDHPVNVEEAIHDTQDLTHAYPPSSYDGSSHLAS